MGKILKGVIGYVVSTPEL